MGCACGRDSCCDGGRPSPCPESHALDLSVLYPYPYGHPYHGHDPCPCPYPYPCPCLSRGHGHGLARDHVPGHYGDGGCESGLDVAEASAYQFAKRMKEGSLPTVCLGVNPRTCARACHNRRLQRRGCCETQRMRNCDSRGMLSFRSDSTRDRMARKTTALEIERKRCVHACVRAETTGERAAKKALVALQRRE